MFYTLLTKKLLVESYISLQQNCDSPKDGMLYTIDSLLVAYLE